MELYARDRLGLLDALQIFMARGGFIERKTLRGLLEDAAVFAATILLSLVICRLAEWVIFNWGNLASLAEQYTQLGFVLGLLLIASLVVALLWGVLGTRVAYATAGINQELSFQGKVVDSSGINIPDGTYNVEFKVYAGGTASGGGTLDWTEDSLVSNGDGITFSGGTFQVNLGQFCPFAGGSCSPSNANDGNANTAIDWNSHPLYLSLQVGNTSSCTPTSNNFKTVCGGDNEMTPYILLTSTPYAMNAGELNGLTAASFGQLGSNQNWTGTNAFQATSTTALQVQNTGGSKTTFAVDTSGGQILLGQTGASGQNGQLVFNSATAGNYAVTLNISGSQAASYSLTLPTTGPSTGQCLQSGAVTASQLAFGACATLQTAYASGSTITTTASGTLAIAAGAAPTANMVSISNAGKGVTTNNANGLGINFVGGNVAVEAAGLRIDYTPGGTSGSTWDGLHIVANATGAATGVTSYGIKLEGPTSAGGGTDEAAYIGTGWDIGIDIQSGGLQLAAQSDPVTPAAGNLRIYAKDIAGRIMPKWVGPAGVDTPFQANLGFNRVGWCTPAGGTTLTTFISCMGSTFTNTGTANNPTPTTTNLLTSTRRATYSTGTTAGTVASNRQSVLQVWRGNAAGRGGFFYTIRFGTDTLASGNRAFVGLADSISAPTNVDPTTNTTPGRIGLAINSNTGDWNLINNITGTAPTVTNLGASFPVNTTDLYELIFFAAPDATTIGYRVTDISTGAQTSGSLSTNIPASTTFLSPQFWITNNATAAAAIFDFGGWYLESDN